MEDDFSALLDTFPRQLTHSEAGLDRNLTEKSTKITFFSIELFASNLREIDLQIMTLRYGGA
jgi:hypothetical protein